MRIFALLAAAVVATCVGADTVMAAVVGQPEPWQLGMQPAASPVRERVDELHTFILVIITGIVLFVLGLLLWVMWRYNRRANPEPATFTHNAMIEVIWTLVPVLILVAIGIPSFRLLYFVDTIPEADMTIKATGYQWYWGYQYPDHGDFEFFANPVPDDALGSDHFGNPQPRLLATDNDVVVPAGKTIRVVVTAADVLHSFAAPSLGLKRDAVPGRLNETWFRADEPGMYYGQCSQMCGARHAFMPIAIRVVPEAEFNQWVVAQGGSLPGATADRAAITHGGDTQARSDSTALAAVAGR